MLADEIAEGKFTIKSADGRVAVDSLNDSMMHKARSSVVVFSGEVEEYCKRIEIVHVRDLPCITPPFPQMMVCGRHACGLTKQNWVVYLGTDLVDSDHERSLLGKSLSEIWGTDIQIDQRSKWSVEGVVYMHPNEETDATVTQHHIQLVSASGQWLQGWSVGPELEKEASNWAVAVSFTTVSFMHCKNVVQRVVAPPPKLSKRHKERHGRPLFSYRVLEIEPMKQVLRTEGRSEEVGLAKALHICRGHFKDYRERGLFGRNKGLYWWDQHVRGSIEAGIAAKDYSVKAPEQVKP
jgi:hypothetical protein